VANDNRRLSERVEVFTRATTDALNKAISEVLAAQGPWQLLYRLSRIVFLGLVLYLGWILVVVQPDLARRLMLPPGQSLAQRYGRHQEQVRTLLRSGAASGTFGLHSLVLAEWDGAGSLKVLAAEGETAKLPLEPGEERLVSVAMARVLGHAALGLCESEQPSALNLEASDLPPGTTVMVCPIGCSQLQPTGLLLGLYAPERPAPPTASAGRPSPTTGERKPDPQGRLTDRERLHRLQREQLMLFSRRLGLLLQPE
jgi:hypothetical protein